MRLTDAYLDETAVNDGVWTRCPRLPIEMKIRSSMCPGFQEAMARMFTADQIAGIQEGDDAPYDEGRMAECIAGELVADWRSTRADDPIVGKNGKALKFSKKAAIEYLCDPRARYLLNWVWRVARDVARYREGAVKKTVGN